MFILYGEIYRFNCYQRTNDNEIKIIVIYDNNIMDKHIGSCNR